MANGLTCELEFVSGGRRGTAHLGRSRVLTVLLTQAGNEIAGGVRVPCGHPAGTTPCARELANAVSNSPPTYSRSSHAAL